MIIQEYNNHAMGEGWDMIPHQIYARLGNEQQKEIESLARTALKNNKPISEADLYQFTNDDGET